MDRAGWKRLQKEQAAKDPQVKAIIDMAEEVAEIFVDGLGDCDEYMAMTMATIQPFKDDKEGIKMKHSIDLLCQAIYSALVYNTSKDQVEDFDIDHTVEDEDDGSKAIVFHARRLANTIVDEDDE